MVQPPIAKEREREREWIGLEVTSFTLICYSRPSLQPCTSSYSRLSLQPCTSSYSRLSLQPCTSSYSRLSLQPCTSSYSRPSLQPCTSSYSRLSLQPCTSSYSRLSLQPCTSSYSRPSLQPCTSSYSRPSLKRHANYFVFHTHCVHSRHFSIFPNVHNIDTTRPQRWKDEFVPCLAGISKTAVHNESASYIKYYPQCNKETKTMNILRI